MSEVEKLLEDETVYQGSLTELVRIGFGRESSEALVDQDSSTDVEDVQEDMIENQEFISDLLEEEITSQFTDSKRPLVELVPNAIDARPPEADNYPVEINYDGDTFSIEDNGDSMGLNQILQSLVVPFSSDKDVKNTNIGQFGVGFLSNLQYTVNQGSEIEVRTNDGDTAFETVFWSEGSARDINTRIIETRGRNRGTQIEIDSLDFDQQELNDFFTRYLNFVDPQTAQISFNGETINQQSDDMFRVQGSERYNGFKPSKSSRISIQESEQDSGELHLRSQGVLVESSNLGTGYEVHVDFPSEVDLTEGRNKLLKDEALTSYVLNTVQNFTERNLPEGQRKALREVIPQLMSETDTNILSITDSDLEREINQGLVRQFLDSDYLLESEDNTVRPSMGHEALEHFFGQVPGENYVPESRTARSFWETKIRRASKSYIETGTGELVEPDFDIGDGRDLLEDFTTEAGASDEIYDLIRQHTGDEHHETTFVETVTPHEGDIPFAYDSNSEELYVNVGHSLIDPENSMTKSMLKDRYREALGMDESGIEDEVIYNV